MIARSISATILSALSSVKGELTMADVSADWGHSGASYTEYVNPAGNRAGSSTISWGDGYTLKADGTS